MLLRKTDKARSALRERDRALGAAERRALIVCDGQRGLDELTRLLGPDILSTLDRLRGQGYLEVVPAPAPLAERVRSIASDLLGGGAPPTDAAAAPSPPRAVQAPVARPSTESRRSLAATKMYMLDMLQLQRSTEAAALRLAIQTAAGDEAMVAEVLRALGYIRQQASASYAARVGERLAEVLPEDHLSRLAAMRMAAAGSAAA